MSSHILMSHATRLPSRNIPSLPKDTQYDIAQGYWILNNKPLVTTDEFLKSSLYTKKRQGQETGEDQRHE